MSDIIATLLLRNLREVFGEGDPTRRRAAIEDLYAEDCVVLLPLGRYVGHQALDQIASELRAGHPSFVYTPHSAPQAVQDGGRIAWGSGPANRPATPGLMSSSSATGRSPPSTSSSTHRLREVEHGCQSPSRRDVASVMAATSARTCL